MFKITGGKGFHIEFDNGVTVSVQFGPGNYCDNYDMRFGDKRIGNIESTTAEVAVWLSGDKLITKQWPGSFGDEVLGRQTPEDVLSILKWAASWKEAKV